MGADAREFITSFEKRLTSQVGYAKDGDIKSVFNILTYFSAKAELDEVPDNDVLSVVAKYLKASQSKTRYKQHVRNRLIRLKVELARKAVKTHKRGKSFVIRILDIQEEYNLSESRIIAIADMAVDPVVEFCEGLHDEMKLGGEQIRAVAPIVDVLRKDIMRDDKTGERVRQRLKLKGYRWWKGSKELHREIVNDVAELREGGKSPTESLDIVVKRSGLSRGSVENILQRAKSNTGDEKK